MPGFRPKPRQVKNEAPDEEQQENNQTSLPFGYMTMRSPQMGRVVYAMTFEQIIEFIDDITDTLTPGEESAMFHLNQIRRILRRYIKHGDGTND